MIVLLMGCGDTPPAEPLLDSGPDVSVDPGGRDAAVDLGGTDSANEDASPLDLPAFVSFWGGFGRDPGQFIEPSSIELDSDGNVYVAGHEDRFQKFTADGELLEIYGSPGAGDGEFNHPHGLAVDRRRGDLIYVGDQENHRLQVFTPDGTFVRQWGDELFVHIHDVGIDPSSGDVFVGDLERHIVRKFTAAGGLLATYGGLGDGPGEFNGVWGMSTDSDGNVYLGDTNNRRVQKLDREGNFIAEWSGFDGVSFVKPTGVFVDHNDIVYVCDSLPALILVFDADGTPLERWPLLELIDFPTEPEDIVINPLTEDIYIAEVLRHRVLHLR